MSIGNEDLQILKNLLLHDRIGQQNLETISGMVQKQFEKSEYYKICRLLTFLLQHDFIHNALSRFTALYVMWELYKSEPLVSNPFAEFLLSYLKDTSTGLPVPALVALHSIFTQADQMAEFMKCTPVQIFSLNTNAHGHNLDWTFLQAESHAIADRLPKIATCGIPGVIPDKDVPPCNASSVSTPESLRQCLETLLSHGEPAASRAHLRPEFIRIAPPLLPCPQGSGIPFDDETETNDNRPCRTSGWQEELVWLNPFVIHHEFHWDASIEQITPTKELRHMITKALTSVPSQTEQQTIVQMITEDPSVVHCLGITPDNLSSLVNRSPVIAIEVMAALATTPEVTLYYDALVSMDPTVDALELVNRLASRVKLPKEFIHAYISKCMNHCHSLQDKPIQQRHVRLVCVLIQSFIRNKILDIHNENILVEVQVFCLDFIKVNGASQLYRLIKNMESSTGNPS